MPAFRIIFLCAFLASPVAVLHGQSAGDGTLTSIADILALDGLDARQNPRPVRLNCVVLGESTMFNFMSVHDGVRGLGVILKRAHPSVKQGDEVEITGQTMMTSVAGHMHPRVAAESIRVTGAGKLPQPTAVPAMDLTDVSFYDQWVSIDGFVLEWKYKAPDFQVRLVCRDGIADANVTVPDAASLPPSLHGARLRITGAVVSTPSLGKVLFVPDAKQMEIVEPGMEDVFAAPPASIDAVVQRQLEFARRWRVKGVVAAVTPDRKVFLTGPEGGMTCQMQPSRGQEQAGTIYSDSGLWPTPVAGDEMELVGSIVSSDPTDADLRACGLIGCQGRVIGKSAPPKAKPVELETLLGWKNHDDWVSVEGVVTAWIQQGGTLGCSILGTHSSAQILVRNAGPALPADLHGARLRFTGMSRSLLQSRTDVLHVTGPSFVEVVRAGTRDPFDAPQKDMKDISDGGTSAPERVRIRGVVVGVPDEGVLHVRGRDQAVCIILQRPWPRMEGANGRNVVDCGPWPDVHAGDEVEVMGSAMKNVIEPLPVGFDLYECFIRKLGHPAAAPLPVQASLAEVARGSHTSDLVEVRGRLLALHQVPMEHGEWRTTMLLEAGGEEMAATHHAGGRAGFDRLNVDDDVLVRALVARGSARDPRQLWLLSPADVRSLGVSQAVRTRQFWLWGGGGAAVLALLLGWIAVLRRSSRVQAEAALMLEQRVNERTAELRQTQGELHRALAQERELGELKTRFVAMVSHEFRTPLGVIMSSVELLQHYSDRLPEDEKRQQLAAIQSSTRHMGGLMEQVLVLGRVEAGKLACHQQPLDVAAFVARIVDEMQSISGHKCPVETTIEGSLDGAAGDEALLRHIFGNLIANAVKYSPAKSIVIFRIRRAGADAVFEVIDHGIGIPEEDRERLFEAFHRGSNVGDAPGTGLGLVIVRRCVDLHGGSIELSSETGAGTAFTVRLPLFARDTP
ncbi:MAG: HAMP domain-containing histidine kinase [Verrucomicrobiaceae bacterium]|nr:HAMP domain-containing histidine kinase [Verrucomicrobiaceae bacterium]